MTQAPIKRSKNLVALSRDHHESLLVVWKIRQGHRYNITNNRIADFVVYAFDKHLEPHFLEEEELLFSKFSSNDELLIQATEQHAAIRKMVKELRSNAEPSTAQLKVFANLLEEHIRFEERTLFPHAEKQLSTEAMEATGAALELAHSKQQPLYWNDEFWLKK